jgi:hypothetical protein
MFVANRRYIQRHLPLIRAERAVAEGEGEEMLKKIGVPVGAVTMSPVGKSFFDEGEDSMWQGEATGVEWTSFWDAPGDHPQIDAWYRDKLLADGWQVFQHGVPSSVQTQYWKDKWLLTVEHEATFANERPPHARFRLRLRWDYWHALGRP